MDSYTPENSAYGAFAVVDAYAGGSGADRPQRAAGLDIAELAWGFMVRQAEPLRVHQLNNTASAVLELCDGQTTVTEIAEGIADAFSLAALPLAEVTACVTELRRAGVLADHAYSRMSPDQTDDPFGFFEAIYCLNLDQRPDRWANALCRFAKLRIATRVERFPAIPTPDNHHVGCARSWRLMVAAARDRGLRNFLGIEDDAIFLDDTREVVRRAIGELEGLTWDLLYLGGAAWEPPAEIPGHATLQSPRGLTCTHAVAVNHTAYDRLLSGIPEADGIEEWITAHAAIDQYLAQQVNAGYYHAYVLNPRVATQIELTAPGGLDGQLRDRYTIR
jgi:Coenzyme PQQ synthesis protein D (PqqD)